MLSIAAREWMAEGAAKGKAEGKAEMLVRLLCRRFKNLPAIIADRVNTADSDQLDAWSDRFVEAQTLDDVFGTEQRH